MYIVHLVICYWSKFQISNPFWNYLFYINWTPGHTVYILKIRTWEGETQRIVYSHKHNACEENTLNWKSLRINTTDFWTNNKNKVARRKNSRVTVYRENENRLYQILVLKGTYSFIIMIGKWPSNDTVTWDNRLGNGCKEMLHQ